MANDTKQQYANYRKPSWAPPAWLFGPVWTILYAAIAVSFGYVGYGTYAGTVPYMVALPFALNLIFNLAFTPIQFRLRNLGLAAIDVVLVLATLAWALIAIHPLVPWVAYANIPYLAWTAFASVLQLTVYRLNRAR